MSDDSVKTLRQPAEPVDDPLTSLLRQGARRLQATHCTSCDRIYGLMIVLWYLMQQFCPHPTWPGQLKVLLSETPNKPWCPDTTMDLPETGFLLQLFK